MSIKDDCAKRIVKIAENNVELQYYLLDPTTYEPIVLDDYTETYGQTRIDNDRVAADAEKAQWDTLTPKDVADSQAAANKAVGFYDLLQTAMNGTDGEMYPITEAVATPEQI